MLAWPWQLRGVAGNATAVVAGTGRKIYTPRRKTERVRIWVYCFKDECLLPSTETGEENLPLRPPRTQASILLSALSSIYPMLGQECGGPIASPMLVTCPLKAGASVMALGKPQVWVCFSFFNTFKQLWCANLCDSPC